MGGGWAFGSHHAALSFLCVIRASFLISNILLSIIFTLINPGLQAHGHVSSTSFGGNALSNVVTDCPRRSPYGRVRR